MDSDSSYLQMPSHLSNISDSLDKVQFFIFFIEIYWFSFTYLQFYSHQKEANICGDWCSCDNCTIGDFSIYFLWTKRKSAGGRCHCCQWFGMRLDCKVCIRIAMINSGENAIHAVVVNLITLYFIHKFKPIEKYWKKVDRRQMQPFQHCYVKE